MRLFKFCSVMATLVVIVGGGWANERGVLEAPVRLIVKAVSIGKIAPDIFEERRSGCTIFVEPGMVSPDLTRVAQLVKRGKRVAVLVDGTASPIYDDPYQEPFCYQPIFSDDGRRYAFTARRGKRVVVVLDGVEVQSYRGCDVERLTFSPRNNQFVYIVTRKSKHGNKCNLVVDGTPLDTYDNVNEPYFSQDGTHMYYSARQGKEEFIVKDGVQGNHYYGSIWLIRLSPDGRRIAYRLEGAAGHMVVVDQTKGKAYDETSAPQFSPDGLHVAYVARHGSEVFQVVDGTEGAHYTEKAEPLLNRWITFSPDGRHTAYMSETAGGARLIIDGVVQKEYSGPIGISLVFSPDDKRLAFYANRRLHAVGLDFEHAASSCVVTDDIVDTHLSDPVSCYLPTMFIPNSGRAGYSLLEEHAIVVDNTSASWLHDPEQDVEAYRLEEKFDIVWRHEYSSNHRAFLAVRKRELFRVEVEIVPQGSAASKPGIALPVAARR